MATIYPVLKYHDAPAAIDFLEKAFGFERGEVTTGDDGKIAHAELAIESAAIGLSSTGAGDERFDQSAGHSAVYVAIGNPDAICESARAAGATIEREPEDQPYGSREFTARDPEGNLWSFGTYELTVSG
jgi:uncharacterized glyoxalase superfamily protein PhnB